MKTSIIAVSTHKGGTGKSTTTANLAAVFASLGKKVLVIDADGQANTTKWLGFANYTEDIAGDLRLAKTGEPTLSNAIISELPLDAVVTQTGNGNIHVVFPGKALGNIANDYAARNNRTFLLHPLVETDALAAYDLVIIDTDGKWNCLLTSVLNISDYYLMPSTPDSEGFDGLTDHIAKTTTEMRRLNARLTNLGVVITRFSKKSATHQTFVPTIKALGAAQGFRVFDTIIPESMAVPMAAALRLTLDIYKPELPVAQGYAALGAEIVPFIQKSRPNRIAQASAVGAASGGIEEEGEDL